MKKSLTRKLTIAVIALVFAVVSLSTSTYAWFTMSNTAQINAFEAQVKAGEGIEIAVTSTNSNAGAQWYTGNVPADVVKAAFEANKFSQFDALTTLDMGKNFVNKDGIAYDQDAQSVGYISFYVHVKTAKAGTVKLTQIKLGSAGKGADANNQWESDAVYKLPAGANGANEGAAVAVGDTVTYKVEDATRISIVKNDNSTIFEKAEDINNNNFAGVKSAYGAFSYYNSKNQNAMIERTDGVNYSDYTDESQKVNNTALDNDTDNITDFVLGTTTDNAPIITFKVNIWLEGWDTECLNAIFAQTLTTMFSLKLQ